MNDMVIVVAHKMFDDSIVPQEYRIIKVGKQLSDVDVDKKGWLRDNSGINIENQNPWYCELTAQYWAWKNLIGTDEIIGLAHYRRYFFDYKKQSKSFSDDILTVEDAKKYLKQYKVILSFPTVKYPGNSSLYKNIDESKQDKHWVIINKIIKEHYPEIYPTFEKIIYGRFITWGNMLVTSKKVFDEYSQWIFEVLNYYDLEISNRGEERIPRVDGFLSELLLVTWMHSKFKKEDILYLEVRNTETDGFEDYKDGLKSSVIRFVRKNRSLLVFCRYLRMIGLLWKRRERGEGSLEYRQRRG